MRHKLTSSLPDHRPHGETPSSDSAPTPDCSIKPARPALQLRPAIGWWRCGLVVATGLAYAHLTAWLGPQLQAAAGGQLPFDLRWAGYSLQDARLYLAALSPAGVALYRGAARLNDTLVPLLLCYVLCLPLRQRPISFKLPALLYALLDLAENIAVDRLLEAGPLVAAEPVALASALTQAKFIAAAVAVLTALDSLVGAWRKR